MNFVTLNIAPDMTSDATFRAWGSAISGGIVAAGLVKTADTGQIDWATVLKPGLGAKAGYEVFRFADALQATHPVFIRIDYGMGGNAGNPMMWNTIGTFSDGAGIVSAGTFPNQTFAADTMFYASTSAWGNTTAAPFYIASDAGSSLMLFGWTMGPSSGGLFSLFERTRNYDGTPNDEGLFLLKAAGGTGGLNTPLFRQLILKNAATFTPLQAISGAPTMFLPGGTSGMAPRTNVVGSTHYVMPVFTGWTPRLNAPSKHVVAIYNVDAVGGTQFPVSLYGEAGTFLSMGTWTGIWTLNPGNSAGIGALRIA